MRGLRVLHKSTDIKGVYIGEPVDVWVPARLVLRHGLTPMPFRPNHIRRFCIDGKTFEGVVIGTDSANVRDFYLRYLADKKRSSLLGEDEPWDPDEANLSSVDILFFYRQGGDTYIFRSDALELYLWEWVENGNKVKQKFVGLKDGTYYYLSAIAGDGNAVEVMFSKRIPDFLVDSFGRDYGYWYSSRGIHEFKFKIWSEAYEVTTKFVDPFPFPPYEVVAALELLPPDDVFYATTQELPESFNQVFVLKSLLVVGGDIPVVRLGAGQLRTFASHVSVNIFDPMMVSNHPEMEYSRLWEICSRFVLLCKPKWPL